MIECLFKIMYNKIRYSLNNLIGVSVSFVANIIGLATIVFKYVFSSTKATTDYISKIDSHN